MRLQRDEKVEPKAKDSLQIDVPEPQELPGARISYTGHCRMGPGMEGCPLFPPNNIWNVLVDRLPVHPDSAAYVNTIGKDDPVHPDFDSGTWEGGPIGVPYTTVPGDQPLKTVTFDYADESDSGRAGWAIGSLPAANLLILNP